MRMSEAEIDKLFRGVDNALHLAAWQARVDAVRTGTPLAINVNGKIEKRKIDISDLPRIRKEFERYLDAEPNNEP